MEYQTATLFLIAILNSVFGYFVIKGNKRNTNILFSLVTTSVSLWSLNLAFFIKTTNLNNALIFANLYYILAATIPLLFFYFSLIFPNKDRKIKKIYYLFSTPFIFFVLSVLNNQNILIKEIFFYQGNKDVVLNKISYGIYFLYFIFFVILSYFFLTKNYKETKSNLEITQLKFVIFGTFISYALGMFFNLFLPLIGNYNYIWLGPPFSLIMVISIGYAIIKHHLFNKKVVATEILTFLLVFFILVRTVIADTLQEQIISGTLLVSVIFAGFFLIRSVIKEIETREKIEKLADDLKTANTRLRKLDKQKSEFISLASHQLRAPITSLKGYSSMILEGSYGQISIGIREVVEKLFQSSKTLSLIIDDFLNLSRIERGKIEFHFSNKNVKEIISEVIDEMKPNIQEKNLELYVKIAKENYLSNIDGEKIKQVIRNLLDNSTKYTIKGSISISLSKSKNKILLKISDTGIGIPQENCSNLFKKFCRLKNANDADIHGTGLGLYLAKEIIEAHDGKIWAKSEGENKGTTFFVELNSV